MTEIHFSQFWRLKAWDWGASMVGFLWILPFLVHRQPSSKCPHTERQEEWALGLFYKSTDLIYEGCILKTLYPHLSKHFHSFLWSTVKGFSIVNEAVVDIFLGLSFLIIRWMLAIWSLVPLPFLIQAWTSGSSQFMYCWSLSWRILSITLLESVMSATVR